MQIILLIGVTGCGKSTIFNFLAGADFIIDNKELAIKIEQIFFSQMKGGMNSVTKDPNFYYNSKNNHMIIDFPGFNDTNGELDQLLFQLLYHKIVTSVPIKIVYVIKNLESTLPNRGSDLQEFIKTLNKNANLDIQKFNLLLNCYIDDLSEQDLKNQIEQELSSVNLQKVIEKILILRKAKTDEDVSKIFNTQIRENLWKEFESIQSFQITPSKLPKTEIISEYLRKTTLSTIASYGKFLCEIFDETYCQMNKLNSQNTLIQLINLQEVLNTQKQEDPLNWFLNFISICEKLANLFKAQSDVITSSNNFKKIFSHFSEFSNFIQGYEDIKITKLIAENELTKIKQIINTRIQFLKKAQEDEAKIKQIQQKLLDLQNEMSNKNKQIQKQNQECQNLKTNFQEMEQKQKTNEMELEKQRQQQKITEQKHTQELKRIQDEQKEEQKVLKNQLQELLNGSKKKDQDLLDLNYKYQRLQSKYESQNYKSSGSSCQLI